MKYEFVYKRNNDWCFEELKVINETIALINDPCHENPVLAIGRHLAAITNVKFLIIGRMVLPAKDKVRSLCFLHYGQPRPAITYNLEHTPCQQVFDYNICYYPVGVKEEFPEDKELVEMNINSYMGTVLTNQAGQKQGLIVLLNETPIQNPGFIEYLLTLVSPVLEQHLEVSELARS